MTCARVRMNSAEVGIVLGAQFRRPRLLMCAHCAADACPRRLLVARSKMFTLVAPSFPALGLSSSLQVRLLRELGAGTSLVGASLVVHKPCGEQAQRDDGVCEKCFFRLQWQAGHRRSEAEVSGGASVVFILPPEERSWRSTTQPHFEDNK